jgi:hypothetical protein
LGLESQPASELIEGTASVWIDRLARIDAAKLNAAFDVIEKTATRWPAPATIIAAIPPYAHVYEPAQPTARRLEVDPEIAAAERARVKALLDGCAAKLGIGESAPPLVDDGCASEHRMEQRA